MPEHDQNVISAALGIAVNLSKLPVSVWFSSSMTLTSGPKKLCNTTHSTLHNTGIDQNFGTSGQRTSFLTSILIHIGDPQSTPTV